MNGLSRILFFRILLLNASIFGAVYFWLKEQYEFFVLFSFVVIGISIGIYFFLTRINSKLTRFFETIEFSDFAVKFSSDNKMGSTFRELNGQMNRVVEAFKQARAEKEATIHFLNAMVQHVTVGIICYNPEGKIEVLNKQALELLGTYRIRNIKELAKAGQEQLFNLISTLESGDKVLYTSTGGKEIAISSNLINLRGKQVKILAFQNIRSELQQKELLAWQNLTKVLRHEIMNSIAPIVSLINTMKVIVDEDLKGRAPEEPLEDISEALNTVEKRGKGVMKFVDAYREFTTLPIPVFDNMKASELLKGLEPLINEYSENLKVVISKDFVLKCDRAQLEMVLINLVKNAYEASIDSEKKEILITVGLQGSQRYISVKDFGKGIIPEALDQIFIPFFSTKKTGQGIGLSLSKQILHQHDGELTVQSTVGKETTFSLLF